jgi:ribosomal-protein-alanine N-acetyltransferase
MPEPPILFRTERLLVRRLVTGDLDAMHAVYGDVEAMRFVGDAEPLAREVCLHWIEVTQHNYATHGYGMSALVLAATGEVVGFCGLVHPGSQEQAELKYALRREHWGAGLATEAARGMLAHGAAEHGLDRVIATVAPAHAASQHVLTKAGMTHAQTRTNADGSTTEVFHWMATEGGAND